MAAPVIIFHTCAHAHTQLLRDAKEVKGEPLHAPLSKGGNFTQSQQRLAQRQQQDQTLTQSHLEVIEFVSRGEELLAAG